MQDERFVDVSPSEFEDLVRTPIQSAELEASVLMEGGHSALAAGALRRGLEESERLRRDLVARSATRQRATSTPTTTPAPTPAPATAESTPPATPTTGPLAAPGSPPPLAWIDNLSPEGSRVMRTLIATQGHLRGLQPEPVGSDPATDLSQPFGLRAPRRR